MSYLPSRKGVGDLAWQGIGYGKQWFALDGLGDNNPAIDVWVKEIAAYIALQRRAGKTDEQIASYLTTKEGAKQFGYLGDELPADWVNAAFKSLASPVRVGMSTGIKIAIGVAVGVAGYLLLRRKRS